MVTDHNVTVSVRLTEILDYFPLRSKKARDYAIWCACCGKPIIADQPELASDGERVHAECEEEYETILYLNEKADDDAAE